MSPLRRAGLRLAAAAAIAAALAGVFTLYLRPGFVVDIADRVWSCF